MTVALRNTLILMAFATLSACTELPRGAALEREILEADTDAPATFQVVEVSRTNAAALKTWPQHGSTTTRWIETSRGPASPLIQTGDSVDITIWDNQVNSLITGPGTNTVAMVGLKVSATGAVFVPYVGDVVIRGLSPDQARENVQTQLTSIAPDAQVQLALTPGVQNSVSFVSGVSSPGSFPLPDRNTTLLAGLALAGGVDANLRNPSVSLIRGGTTYRIPADTLYRDASKNTRLMGGDKIVIQEDDRSFTALGASGLESIIYFPKDRVSALEAISLMGGINDARGDPRGILILREFDDRSVRANASGPTHNDVVFAIDLTSADGLFAARNFNVAPGDTVLATESPITGVSTVLTIVGQAFGLSTTVGTLGN